MDAGSGQHLCMPPISMRGAESMDAIFGLTAKADVFAPENSLFLKRLKKHLIRVSSLLYPMSIWNRKTRTKSATERKLTKEYEVVVLDLDNKLVHFPDSEMISSMKGHSSFTPIFVLVLVIWWTFMNAVRQTAWRQKQNEKNALRQEVAKAT